MTQNLDSLNAQLGPSHTEGLLGNLNLKVAFSNDHVPTNEWMAKKIGEAWTLGASANVSLGGDGGASGGVSESRRYVVEPSEFLKMRRGGEENGFVVEGIALRSGRPFVATNANHIRVRFQQNPT